MHDEESKSEAAISESATTYSPTSELLTGESPTESLQESTALRSLQPLTAKEKMVLEFLEKYILESGIAPSYQEVCNHFGFASLNSVQNYFKQLESKKYIRSAGNNQKRAITVLRPSSALKEVVRSQSAPSPEAVSLPLLGRVAAGAPIEAYEHDEFLEVPTSLVRHADRTYALRVQGQSMIEDGIFDGDFILVQKQATASNGEIVVAMVGDEATVKRFYKHGDEVELRPANSTMRPMRFSRGDVKVRGVVVGLIRKFL